MLDAALRCNNKTPKPVIYYMAIEIEHKFLVNNDSYKEMACSASKITQGFLSRDPERTVRIRIRDNEAFITIKGKGEGAAHPEFEYPIALADATEMLSLCVPPIIIKTRYIVMHEGNRWEIDEFQGELKGLVIAELEVPTEDYSFTLPPFVGKEVTGDPRYYNSQLGIAK